MEAASEFRGGPGRHDPVVPRQSHLVGSAARARGTVLKLVIIGAVGRLGAALRREYQTEFEVLGIDHAQLDLADGARVRATLSSLQFDVLINCAAFTNVDLCETEREGA